MKSEFVPEIKVLVNVNGVEYWATNDVRQLDITHSLTSISTATLVLANVNDTYTVFVNNRRMVVLPVDGYPKFTTMGRIWIWMTSAYDGEWYLVFTGIISQIVDSYVYGSDSTITLNCKGLSRYLEVSYIPLKSSLSTLVNNLHEYLLRKVECFTNRLVNIKEGVGEVSGDDMVKYIIDSVNLEYKGTKDFVNCNFLQNIWDTQTYLKKTTGVSNKISKKFRPVLFIHPKVGESKPFKVMLAQVYELFRTETDTALGLLKKIANTTFYDFYCDSLGNLIYQPPQYDNVPGDGKQVAHGENYIFDSRGYFQEVFGKTREIKSVVFSEDEETAVTGVIVPGDWVMAEIPQVLRDCIIGMYPRLDDLRQKWSLPRVNIYKYGIRLFTAQPVIGVTVQDVLDRYAKAIYNRLNSMVFKVNVTFDLPRPDLQLGRTIYFEDRKSLYYLTAIKISYAFGKSATTSLTGSFGHLVYNPIGDVWEIISRELKRLDSIQSIDVVKQETVEEQKENYISRKEELEEKKSYLEKERDYWKNLLSSLSLPSFSAGYSGSYTKNLSPQDREILEQEKQYRAKLKGVNEELMQVEREIDKLNQQVVIKTLEEKVSGVKDKSERNRLLINELENRKKVFFSNKSTDLIDKQIQKLKLEEEIVHKQEFLQHFKETQAQAEVELPDWVVEQYENDLKELNKKLVQLEI